MSSFCPEQPDQKLRYWCQQCEVLICVECRSTQHRKHPFPSLQDAALAAKDKFQNIMQELDQMERKLMIFSKTTKDIIGQQRELVCLEKQDIEQTFANLQHQLEERKLAMIKQLENQALETMNTLDEQQTVID